VHCNIKFIKTKERSHVVRGNVVKDGPGHWRLTIGDITSMANFVRGVSCTVEYKQSALDLIHLYTQEHIAKHHKYVSGVHAEKIVNIEDIGVRDIYNLTAEE
jgi:hypothetical protein